MKGNIDLRINTTTNMGNTIAQFEAMRKQMMLMQKEADRLSKQVAQGRGDPAGDFSRLNSTMEAYRRNSNALIQQSGQFYTATRSLKDGTSEFNESLAKQSVRLKDVVKNFRGVHQAMKEQMNIQNMVVRSYGRDATGKVDADFFVPKTTELGRLINLRKQLGYYNEVMKSVSIQTINWGKNTQWAGRQLMVGFSVPISIAAGALTRFALQADEELVRIVKVYGDTESAFQASNESIRNMAQETARYVAEQYGLAAQETRDVMGELAATGLEGRELQGMTVQVQRASLLGGMTSDESLKLLRIMREVYGFTSAEIEKQVNYFNEIENSTALTMQDITEGMPRIAGIMKSTGTSIQEQTELLVAFKSAGIDVAEGANALKSINFKAIAPTPTAMKHFFNITGQDMQEVIDRANGEFIPMMVEIAKSMEHLDQQAKVDLVARVFGIHQGSRAITLLDQLAKGSEGMLRAQQIGLKDVEEIAQSANKEIAAVQESLSTRFKRTVESIKMSFVEMGEPVAAALIPIAEVVKSIIDRFNDMSDGQKKVVLWVSGFLAIAGPLVMLTGLFANLAGQAGKFVTGLISIFAPMEIMTAEMKAAELVRKEIAKLIEVTTGKYKAEEEHIDMLSKALENQNKTLSKTMDTWKRFGDTVAQASGIPVTPVGAASGQNLKERADKFGVSAEGLTRAQFRYEVDYAEALKMHEEFVKEQSKTERTRYVASEKARAAHERAERKKILTIEREEKASATRRIQAEAEMIKKKEVMSMRFAKTISATIGTASSLAMGASILTGNETVGAISSALFGISMAAPLIEHTFGTIFKSFGKLEISSKIASEGMRKAFVSATAGMRSAAVGFMSFMTGPWGIAIAGAAILAGAVWAKHRKEIAETRKAYKDMADSAELVAQAYNFIPSSPLERVLEGDPDAYATSGAGQRMRIEKIKNDNKELYDTILTYSKEIEKIDDERIRKQEYLNTALARGAEVLAQTGDSNLAKQVAWDFYNAMTGEFMSFEEFKLKIGIDLNNLYESLDRAAEILKARKEQFENDDDLLNWRLNIDPASEEKIKADTKKLWDSLRAITNPHELNQAINEHLGSEINTMQELYFQAIEDELITSKDSIQDFWGDIIEYQKEAASFHRDDEIGKLFASYTPEQLSIIRAMVETINDADPSAMKAIGNDQYYKTASQAISGLTMLIQEHTNTVKVSRLEDQLATADAAANALAVARATGDAIKIQTAERELGTLASQEYRNQLVKAINAEKEMGRERANAAVDQQRVNSVVAAAQSSLDLGAQAGGNFADSLEEISDEATEAKSALEGLDESSRRIYDAFKYASGQAQGDLVDEYVRQFDKIQENERKAAQARWDARIDEVEAEHDAIEKAAQLNAKAREKSLEARHKEQKKALDLEKEAATDALKRTQDAEKKALDNRSKAAREQQKEEQKALKKAHEARRDRINETYDLQVEKINAQIEEEERLEKIRQQMFEDEKERLRRLQSMFSSNIDLNMAINSGDLDEAARIAGEMRTRQGEWAQDDLSRISQEGSDSRKDKMRAEIDSINERRDAELERIKDVEEAEQEALEKKFDRIQAEIDAEKEKQAELHQIQKKALDDEFAMRSENLANRQTKEKEALTATLEAERETRATNRSEAIAEQEAANQREQQTLNESQERHRKSFNRIADHWRTMEAQNYDEFVRQHDNMHEDFKDHTGGIERVNRGSLEVIWGDAKKAHNKKMDELMNQKMWEEYADKIVDAILKGSFGFDGWSTGDVRNFIVEGKLPKNQSKMIAGARSGVAYRQEVRHSGGIVGGAGSSRFGPGARPSLETDVTMLKGEGVLNLRAMSQPGVKEMMQSLNSGRPLLQNPTGPGVEKNALPGGAGGIGGFLAALPMMMRRITDQLTLAGLEVGISKAEAMISGVDIKLGEKERQGLDDSQLANASAIVSTGKRLGASDRDILVALMTAMQESSLRNISYGDDIHGVRNPDGSLTSSLGLFQQQKWWGTRAERMDPYRSSELFYNALSRVGNRNQMPLWAAAQEVQKSAHPTAYARWESLARVLLGGAMVSDVSNVSPNRSNKERLADLKKRMEAVKEAQKGYFMPTSGLVTWLFGPRKLFAFPDHHDGLDIANTVGTPVYAAASGTASTGYSIAGGRYVSVNSDDGSRHIYYHLSGTNIRNGQEIIRGQRIASMGNTGTMTTGPHLHFEVQRNGRPVPAENFFTPRPVKRGHVTAGQGVRLRNGGFVPGGGFGDITPAMLEPGEFVVNRASTKKNVELLKAINTSNVDFTPDFNALGHSSINSRGGGVDNGSGNNYNIKMEFTGPVNSEIDIEAAVKRAIRAEEKRKPRSRSIR